MYVVGGGVASIEPLRVRILLNLSSTHLSFISLLSHLHRSPFPPPSHRSQIQRQLCLTVVHKLHGIHSVPCTRICGPAYTIYMYICNIYTSLHVLAMCGHNQQNIIRRFNRHYGAFHPLDVRIDSGLYALAISLSRYCTYVEFHMRNANYL